MLRYRLLTLLFVLSVPMGLSACKDEGAGVKTPNASHYALSIETQSGKSHDFTVELALTGAQQAQGLMNRTQLADDAGMLFYFGKEVERSFWMKNTLIPLDLIFIKANGTIHHIHENAIPGDLTPIPSKGEVMAALEINGGESRKRGISAGDRVKHSFFIEKSPE